jgi:lysophospholipase L1-like esterase
VQKMGVSTPVEPDRTLEYTQQYAAAVLDLGRQLQVPVVDLFHKLQHTPGWQTELLKDGLHFTPAGSMAVWQQLQEVLAAQLPHIR